MIRTLLLAALCYDVDKASRSNEMQLLVRSNADGGQVECEWDSKATYFGWDQTLLPFSSMTTCPSSLTKLPLCS